MIYEILEEFKKKYEEEGDKLILDNYQLKEGLYVEISSDNDLQYFIAKKQKQDLIFTDLNNNIRKDDENRFKERDYYSVYLNSNKSFYDKKIHSINYLTFFVKLESFVGEDEKKILKRKIIEEHFNAFKDYKKFDKKQEKDTLKAYEQLLSDKNRQKDIEEKYRILTEKLPEIIEKAKELQIKNYIKIFFDEETEKYKKESEVYYAIKIFNDIKYNIVLNHLTYGLSNSNMGLNSKKPYLETKTRKNPIPFYVKKEDAFLLKKFFDWLKYQKYSDLYLKFFMRKQSKNDEAEIVDFDCLPFKESSENKSIKLIKPFILKNHLLIKKEQNLIEDEKIEYLNLLEDKIDDIFYNKQLKNNYYDEVYKKLDKSFANLIYLTRDAMVSYFRKYNNKDFYPIVKKYASRFVIEHIRKNSFYKAGQSLNLKFSILEHIGESVMNIKQMQNEMLQKLENNNYEKLTKDEFFYLCGQVARYLIGQSKAGDKKGDMLEPYLRANNSQKLKKVIEFEYFKYKHSINLHFTKFNNAISLIMAFDEIEKLSDNNNTDNFLVGALSDNIFYIKKENKED